MDPLPLVAGVPVLDDDQCFTAAVDLLAVEELATKRGAEWLKPGVPPGAVDIDGHA